MNDSVRLGQLLLALSVAIDLGLGLPMETIMRSALLARRLGDAAGFALPDVSAAYQLALLRFVGCTTSSHGDADLFGNELGAAALMTADDTEIIGALRRSIGPGEPLPQRAAMFGNAIGFAISGALTAQHRIHCEAAALIARRMNLSLKVQTGITHLYERWDGRGDPDHLAGEAISLPMRAVHVGQFAAMVSRDHPPSEVARLVRARAGRQLDPQLAAVFAENAGDLLADFDTADIAAAVVAAEPDPVDLTGDALERALEAIADFGDLKTPHMLGHSRRVAELAEDAARRASLPPGDTRLVRHAGLIHDVGRVGVPEKIWVKTGPLTPGERERVRLHAYLTERIFADTPTLAEAGRIGGAHHERLDGTGYHRGLGAGGQTAVMRLLATANAYCALTEPRPHRPTMTPAEAALELQGQARSGQLDKRAVDAVLSAAGAMPTRRRAANISLSEREIEVLRLVALQHTNKQIARTLGISPKTVERHVTHIYDKIGATTRAGAALYALEKGLT
jgi:HD-GYP domain-containing protein (c-di-GMP phosphodiesterase class II)